MDDLISRQAAIDAMANTLWHYPNECYRNLNEYEFAKKLAELGLKSVPSAQPEVLACGEGELIAQPEIVRCKDCKWKQGSECVRFAEVRPFPDDFCSRAERRTDEPN